MVISINRTPAVRTLIVISGILIGLNLLTIVSTYVFGYGRIYGLIPLLSLDKENNIPTTYAFILLVISGLLFLLIANIKRLERDASARKFRFLGFLFLYIAVDEISSLHELLTEPLKDLWHFEGIFYHAWIVVVIPLLVLLTVYLWRFYFALPKEFRIRLAAAAVIFLSGALGFEILEGLYASNHGRLNAVNALLATVEESLELFGVIILIDSLLRFIVSLQKNGTVKQIRITFT